MKCISCGAEIAEGASFCGRCGARAAANRYCPNCNAGLHPDASFCPSCGAQQDAPSGSQREGSGRQRSAVKATTRPSKKVKRMSGRSLLGRIAMVLVGLLLLLFGLSQQLLLVAGDTTTATVTDVQIETDDDDPTERYYDVRYRFSVKGTTYTGSYNISVGSGRAPSKGSTVRVAYLGFLPSVNARDDGIGLGVTGLLMMAVGGLLIFLQFRK